MYKPALPRPKKTNIVRTRTGCKGCRKRRTKCDERKPSCGTCARLGKPCEPVSPKLRFRNLTFAPTGTERQHGKDGSSRDVDTLVGPSLDLLLPAQTPPAPDTSRRFSSFDPYLHLDEPHNDDRRLVVGLPPALLPRRDPSDVIVFYMDAWRKQCVPGLRLTFHQLEDTCHSPTILTDIKVALSACRLSRVLPQRKVSSSSATASLCFRPDAGHEAVSHERYGAVMRKMAGWSHWDFDANPALGLAVPVLFCYLESSMGNFREFRLHSEGAKRLMQTYSDWVACRGGGLLAAWVEVEMQNWWRRVYFSTPDFPRTHGTLSLPTSLEGALNVGDHQRAAVLLILCESHRLHNAAIVSAWNACGDKGTVSYIDPTPVLGITERQSLERDLSAADYASLLRVQSKKLDDWWSLLPISDLPEDWQNTEKNVAQYVTEPDGLPLRFNSHNSAMNFAYYVTARVMQCTGPLESLEAPSQADVDSAYAETEVWISILLRIAAGINWQECVRLNVYTIGFTSLLLACALRSRCLVTGLWMQDWLERRLKDYDFEEGNFPVFQVLETVRLINCERMNGLDVFALFQTVDDGGGSGKLGSYHSQMLVSLCAYGRCRASGRLWTYRRTLFE